MVSGKVVVSLCSFYDWFLFCFQDLPEREPCEDLEKCCSSGESLAPGCTALGLIKPFLDGEGIMLDGAPEMYNPEQGSLRSYCISQDPRPAPSREDPGSKINTN